MTMKDPVVEEVHRARRELWDECEGDFQKLLGKLKAIEAEEKHRVISLEKLKELKKAKPSSTPN
jgi:hypothetical protein